MSKTKNNFPSMYEDKLCRFCLEVNSDESLQHFCQCSTLIQTIPEVANIDPDDIFGEIQVQVKAVRIWRKVFNKLENIDTRSTDPSVPHVQTADPIVNPICT